MENKKQIVWDIFGGLNNSVLNAIGKENYDIYTFDIIGNFTLKLDMTMIIEDIHNLLDTFPKPDIIVGSPPCKCFSRAAALTGGNHCWVSVEPKLRPRRENEYYGSRFNVEKCKETRSIGVKCIANLIQIINIYKPKYWYIENPKQSFMWRYIKEHGILLELLGKDIFWNKTKYYNYGFPSSKPTIFLSNIDLNLNDDRHKTLCTVNNRGFNTDVLTSLKNYQGKSFEYLSKDLRSVIPNSLIQDIFKEFK